MYVRINVTIVAINSLGEVLLSYRLC